MKLSHFKMYMKIYKDSKRRVDLDNLTPKFIQDGFTESGFIVDDDSEHLYSLTIEAGCDKKHPRTEIILNYD